MSLSPATRPSLLVRIRDARDGEAWRQFVEIYAPLVHRYGMKNGLQDSDAADLVQDVLQTVAGTAPRFDYDPRRGSFRGWLFTVTRNRIRHLLARRRREPQGSGDDAMQERLEQEPERSPAREAWDEEFRWRLFAWAAERVRGGFQDSTWQAFWWTAVERRPARTVAAELGMTVGAVYIARSRVLARLREEARQVTDE